MKPDVVTGWVWLGGGMPLSYPVTIPSAVTNEPVYLSDVPNRCFWSISQLSQSFISPVLTCLKLIAVITLQAWTKSIILNIKYLFFVLYSSEYRTKICTSVHSIFICVFHRIPAFIKQGLYTLIYSVDVKIWDKQFSKTHLYLLYRHSRTRNKACWWLNWFVIEVKTSFEQIQLKF